MIIGRTLANAKTVASRTAESIFGEWCSYGHPVELAMVERIISRLELSESFSPLANNLKKLVTSTRRYEVVAIVATRDFFMWPTEY